MDHPEDYFFYTFKPINQIGDTESTYELAMIFENEKNLMNYQYCKKIVSQSANAGVKAAFDMVTVDLAGKISGMTENVSGSQFQERVLKKIEERLKITKKIDYADNDYGYLCKCVALKFKNTSLMLVVSEELIQLSKSKSYIENLVKLYRFNHSIVSLCCRIGVETPVKYSNYLTMSIDENLSTIDYPKLVADLKKYVEDHMSIHHDPHSGGYCISYTNQYHPIMRGLLKLINDAIA